MESEVERAADALASYVARMVKRHQDDAEGALLAPLLIEQTEYFLSTRGPYD